eukprot:1013993_1
MARKKRSSILILKLAFLVMVLASSVNLWCIYSSYQAPHDAYQSSISETIATNNTALAPTPYSNIILYWYESNFTDLYESAYTCEVRSYDNYFQHIPDYYFFKQLKNLNVIHAHNIKQLDTLLSLSRNQIIFIVPIWNDILSRLVYDGHLNGNRCAKKLLKQTKYKTIGRHGIDTNRLILDIRQELQANVFEFENYIESHHIICSRGTLNCSYLSYILIIETKRDGMV